MTAPGRPFSVRHTPAFALFWSSQSLSNLGDALSVVGVQLLAIQITGSIVSLAVLTSIWGVARIAASAVAGPIVDRVDRRKLMLWCDAGRALLLLALPIGRALGVPVLPMLYGVMVAAPALAALFEVAYISVVPSLVDAEHVDRANTLLWTSRATAAAVGPAVAGLISHAWGPATALGIDGATFVLSGLALAVIRFRAARPAAVVPEAARGASAGLRFLFGDAVFLAVTVVGCALGFMSQGAMNLVMFRLKTGLGADDVVVGVVTAIGSAGGILGTLVAARVHRGLGLAGALCLSALLEAVGALWLGIAWLPFAMAPGVVVALLGDWLQGTIAVSLYQQRAPEALRGRVVAAQWTLRLVVTPVGTMLVGVVAAELGARATLLAMAAFFVVLAAATWLARRQFGPRAAS